MLIHNPILFIISFKLSYSAVIFHWPLSRLVLYTHIYLLFVKVNTQNTTHARQQHPFSTWTVVIETIEILLSGKTQPSCDSNYIYYIHACICTCTFKAGIRSWEVSGTNSPADWVLTHKPTELSRIKLKSWTQQPVPMMSENSAHLTKLLIGFRTWLWRYTCMLLLISMLWAQASDFRTGRRQVVFLCAMRDLKLGNIHIQKHIYKYLRMHKHAHIHAYIFIFADEADQPIEVLSVNQADHNGQPSTTGHPVHLSVNSMDDGPPPSYRKPTAPPSYDEWESYSAPFPLDETPEPPSIYSPPDDDNPMPEVRVVY